MTPESIQIDPDGQDSWKIVVKGLSGDIKATFETQATVKKDLSPGSLVAASISGEVTSTPTINMEIGKSTIVSAETGKTANDFTENAGCRGYVQTSWTAKPGTWLLDLKAFDGAGNGKVKVDKGPFNNASTNPVNWKDPSTFNSIKVIAGGEDITERVLKASTYVSPDPSGTTFPVTNVDAAKAKWLDSTNWDWNSANWTGNTWLPEGAEITATKGFTFENCREPGVPTDGDTERKVGMVLEITRPVMTAEESAEDLFITTDEKGEKPPLPDTAWCEDIFVTLGTLKTLTNIQQFDGKDLFGAIPYPKPSPYNGTIAVSPLRKNRIIYLDKQGTLYETKFKNEDNALISNPVGQSLGLPSLPASKYGFALGVDPEGVIWAFDISTRILRSIKPTPLNPKEGEESSDSSNQKTGWIVHGTLDNPRVKTREAFYDLAFTSNGDLLVFGEANARESRNYKGLFTFTKDSISKERSEAELIKPSSIIDYEMIPGHELSQVNGFAIAKDGKMYMGGTPVSNAVGREIYYLPPKGGEVTIATNIGRPYIADMGSCSFADLPLTPQPPAGPKFQVQKSAIDPVTGAVAKAGTTTLNPVQISAEGATTVDYLVTVANTGTVAGNPGIIRDQFVAPEGFEITDVLVDGESVGKDPNQQFTPGIIQPTDLVSYRMTIQLQAQNLAVLENLNGQCTTEGPGQSGGGFFNSVTMDRDSDGPDNNDACVPVKPRPKAHLKLVKQIVDQDGRILPNQADATKFLLSAGSGDPAQTLTALNGTTGSPQVDKDVIAGKYQLREQPAAGQPAGQYFKLGDWSCDSGKQVENGKVQINENDNVTCTVKNTRMPLVHVVKTPVVASTVEAPGVPNPQIGQAVKPEPVAGTDPLKYRVDFKYQVTVFNDSNFEASTGPVKDFFKVPAGLKWDDELVSPAVLKPATVTFAAGDPAATPVELKSEVSKEALEGPQGATLAQDLKIPANSSASFTVSIPLVLDMTPSGDSTVYAQHAEQLGKCESLNVRGEQVTTSKFGVSNRVAIQNENLDYNKVPILDNIACIPVKPGSKWNVEKVAVNITQADNQETFTVGSPEGTPVRVTQAGEGKLQATARYLVTVTNTGQTPSNQPQVTDMVTLPEGWTVTDTKLYRVTKKVQQNATFTNAELTEMPAQLNDGRLEIPAGTEEVAAEGKVHYLVQVTGQAQEADVKWETAGKCETADGGTPGKGFFNQVSIPGDEGTDGNNDACVPVGPGEVELMIRKTDQDGSHPLKGAQFVVCEQSQLNDRSTCQAAQVATEAKPDAITDKDLAQATFFAKLKPGTDYWLVETKAPLCQTPNKSEEYCAALLPEPLRFQIDAAGRVTSGKVTSGPVGEDCNYLTDNSCVDRGSVNNVDGTFYLYDGVVNVRDPRNGTLPISGGTGPLPYALAAGLLLLLSLGYGFRSSLRTIPSSRS
ncbi:SpaA isopeptide-forming pilin-related protein [Boudabousia liubingyangii]|uniref:SpaA isopeptide-forming pilin-related protein n=1 Tax=Boudabousia liubingyangii TaxID=1921764 RepID=UPI00093F0224|nr:prealbumin-like fold domain-containing protein [Boudabousia liubingyangii]